MTETISPAQSVPAESPQVPRPETDAADRRAIADHETHHFASKDMPGKQREIQDCVNKILAKVDSEPAAN